MSTTTIAASTSPADYAAVAPAQALGALTSSSLTHASGASKGKTPMDSIVHSVQAQPDLRDAALALGAHTWDWTRRQAAAVADGIGSFDAANGHVVTRAAGVVQAAGGAAEAVVGGTLAGVGATATATGVGAAPGLPAIVGGAALAANGLDSAVAGVRTALTGQFHHTLTAQAAGAAAHALGASAIRAERITSDVDVAQGVVGGLGTVAAGLARMSASAAAAIQSAGRTFTSTDPLVGDLANEIEAAHPGHVVGVNVPIRNAAGQLVTDADIQLKNAVIQVKSGGGKGLTSQLARTEAATGLPTVGYGPNLKPSVVKSIQQAGGLVTTDKDLLIDVVKP